MTRGITVIDTRQIDRLAIELRGFEHEIVTASYHAIKRALDSALTVTAREVSKVYNIKAAEVKLPKDATTAAIRNKIVNIRIKKPSMNDLSSSVEYKGRTLTFTHFGITPQKKMLPTRVEQPVKVKVMKTGGFKKLLANPKPFVFKFPTNVKFNVWHRTGRSFYQIEPIRTLSVPQMITNAEIQSKISQAIETTFNTRLEHEILRSMTSSSRNVSRR